MANYLDDESNSQDRNARQNSPHHPTIESLVELIEERDRLYRQRYESQQSAVAAAFAAQEKAILAALLAVNDGTQKSDVATEKRFESVNEFRKTLSDQTITFLPRAEFDRAIQGINDKLDAIKSYVDSATGQSKGISTGWGILVGSVSLAAAISALIFTR